MDAPMTTWSHLKKADWIVCPASGLPEQVTSNRPYPGGRRAVRTSRHDHYRPAGEKVTIVPQEKRP